ncbi:aminotransferase class I/II-fold pyridoxal phosphate-dependent enzyme, partial [Kitasatospora sp. NPDC059800]|uniref:aminotransferase class I/II-fold pyridoxal phosphate-dependent enzyme n=1 Tax=Kitasatospora sp. NPDC059800 TaxID=3346951 RepID=UPI0036680B11
MAAAPAARHLLAQNEHPGPPLPSVVAALAAAAGDLHRYPDFRPQRIEGIIADWQGVPAGQVAVGHGSAGVALDLFHAVVEPGDNVVHSAPCFDAYPLFCEIARAEARAVPGGPAPPPPPPPGAGARAAEPTRERVVEKPAPPPPRRL